MQGPNRLVVGLGIAIAALAVIAIVLVLATQNKTTILPQDTPQGTVQRFLLAVQNKDYMTAYGFLQLVEKGTKVTYDEWLREIPNPFPSMRSSWKATLGETTVNGNNATVEVIVDTLRPNGPFGNSTYTQHINFQLTKIGDAWLITIRPPLYWLY